MDNAQSLVFWYETLLSAFEMFKSSIRTAKEYALYYMIACIALTFAIATLYEMIVFVFDRGVVAAVGVAGPGAVIYTVNVIVGLAWVWDVAQRI